MYVAHDTLDRSYQTVIIAGQRDIQKGEEEGLNVDREWERRKEIRRTSGGRKERERNRERERERD